MLVWNSEISSEYDYQGGAYFIRFIIVFGFLIFPLLFSSCFYLFKISNKEKNVSFVLASCRNLKRYEYVFHNFLFVFLLWAFAFNTAFLVYSILDIYIFEFDDVYGSVWHILKDDFKTDDFKTDDRKNTFVAVIIVGGLLHACLCAPYAYFNLYETDSLFGEKGRAGIKYCVMHGNKMDKFRRKCPHLYSLIYHRFLDVKYVYKNNHKKKIVYIDV